MAAKVFFDEALYKRDVNSVAFSIFGFIILYFLLFLVTLALAAGAAALGVALIVFKPHLITLGIGLSLILFGVFIVYFMIKFLFTSKNETDPYRIEIFAENEPALFEVINNLAHQAGTSSPGRVFLSHRVNACVFYNSFSFWSLLFPVKKNLEIGLGLFNTLNVSELSSIIAHEFGHFSQKSMKFGPYIYHANRVIYNMLYENDSWQNSVESIGSSHWTLQIFTGLSVGYSNIIKGIMQKVYEFINVRYMSLSRQMEFHADTVAVNICGTRPFKTAMMKIEWVDVAMNEMLDTLGNLSDKNLKSSNIFELQQSTIKQLAAFNNVHFTGNTIDVQNQNDNKNYYRARVKIEDQWASHPSNADRLENAEALHIEKPENEASSWSLMNNSELLQQSVTSHLYATSNVTATDVISTGEFEQKYEEGLKRYQYPLIYNRYYDNRALDVFDMKELLTENTQRNPLDSVFKANNIRPASLLNGLAQDINLLKEIETENVKIKYFDFDGEKKEAHLSYVCRKQLEDELEQLKQDLRKSDKWVYDYCVSRAGVNGALLTNKYERLFGLYKQSDEFEKMFAEAYNLLNSFQNYREVNFVESQVNNFKNNHLAPITDFWKKITEPQGLLEQYPDEEYKLQLNSFLKENYTYFLSGTLYTDQFNHMLSTCSATMKFFGHCIATEMKTLLELQAESFKQAA